MKRTSERQLTKDDAEADSGDDNADDASGQKGFQKAPPEVMAKRRILKVRRTMPGAAAQSNGNSFAKVVAPAPPVHTAAAATITTTTTAAAAAAPSVTPAPLLPSAPTAEPAAAVNPFAFLATHPVSSANTPAAKMGHNGNIPTTASAESKEDAPRPATAASGKPGDAASDKGAEKPTKRARLSDAGDDFQATISKTIADASKANEKETKIAQETNETDTAELAKENVDTKTSVDQENKQNGHPAGTVQDIGKSGGKSEEADKGLSNYQGVKAALNGGQSTDVEAKDTCTTQNIAEKMPLVVKSDSNASPFKSASFGGIFGSAPSMTFANAAKADTTTLSFGALQKTKGDVSKDAEKATTHTFKEEKVETGEEDEEELFRGRSKLYSLDESEEKAKWRERGIGALKLKQNTKSGRCRLLMRVEATLRVALNTPMFDRMAIDKASERSFRFQGFDVDGDKEKARICFLVRFSDKKVVQEFSDAIDKWKKDGKGE